MAHPDLVEVYDMLGGKVVGVDTKSLTIKTKKGDTVYVVIDKWLVLH